MERALRIAASALLAVLVMGPLVILVLTAFRDTREALPFEPQSQWTVANFWPLLHNPALYAIVLPQTIVYTAAAVAIAVCLGLLFAWLIERSDMPLGSAAFVAIVAPLLVPTVVKAIAWAFLFAPNTGYVNLLLRRILNLSGSGPLDIFSMPGVMLLQGLELVPLATLFVASALRRLDPALEEASAMCGARPLTTLVRVTLPLLLPATLALLIVLTTLTLEMIEIPLAIGTPGGVQVFSTWIFFLLNPAGLLPDYGAIAAGVAPVLILGTILLLIYNRLTRAAERFVTVTGRGYRPRRVALGRWKPVALTACILYSTITLLLPMGTMLIMSLFPDAGRTTAGGLGAVSWAAYSEVLTSAPMRRAFANTLIAGTVGAAVAVSTATMVAWLVVRTHVRGRHLLDYLCFVPITIPAVIMSFAIALLYLVLPIPIYGTVWILAAAYATRMSVASRIVRASLMQLHRELEEASSISGARWLTTFRRIVVPLVAPALLVSFLLVLVVSIRDFTIGLMLSRPTNSVIGVHLWRLYERGHASEASALGLVLIVCVLVLAASARRFLPELGRS